MKERLNNVVNGRRLAIDPRALMTFRAVCQAGSISGAARDLNISQPSVSNTIALLERSLGASLFARGRGGITLTSEGEALQRRAEALATLLVDAALDIDNARLGIAGPLRVAGTPGALLTLLPGVIPEVEAQVGKFSLSVLERDDAQLLDMLRKGVIELAFVTTRIEQRPDDMAEVTCASDPFSLVVGAQHFDLGNEISLQDAAAWNWVLPEARGAFRRQVDALFLSAGVSVPLTAIRCDSLLTTRAIVRETDRVTVLPRTVVGEDIANGSLRAITIREAEFDRNVGVLHLANQPLSPLAQVLFEALPRLE
ncbi:LysR family transcriptional regulator [Novosphingobium sp. 9]|uniref:LysR family transcriptional regulator n=1 Tax=Novosphingobium sp. 9 TaxID=2025349 RepID=UPI0021B557A4|nr:LysR family transcriptional regulator [Novosphingobium sp. 9]